MSLQAAFDAALDVALAAAHARPGEGAGLAVFLRTAQWSHWLDAASGLLDQAERARVQRRHRARDRELATLAYAFHRLLLARVLECPPAAVPLRRDALGCPRLDAGGAHTSLSHADGLVALAVSGAPVGVDIEPAARTAAMDEIATRVAHPRELAAAQALPEAERRRALLSLWVRKEALLKAAGIGMAVEMDAFEAPAGRLLPLPGAVAGSAELRVFEGGDFIAAVAAAPGALVMLPLRAVAGR